MGTPPRPAPGSPPGVLFLLDVWRLRIAYLVPLALILLGLVVVASAWPLRSRRS